MGHLNFFIISDLALAIPTVNKEKQEHRDQNSDVSYKQVALT